MACKTSYDLHHNFPKLAEETGFAFNTHRPRVHIDWNKIRLIDIESLARDRKFVLIEQHVNDILDCVLESEFDVRILDEGVVKLFRLAQLAVEYQQFCRHYLDRSVFVLRQEIDTLAQQLASTKRDLQDREEELRKLRRKGKHNYRPLSYSNDNIATMILKTLTNKGEIFPSTAAAELHQYNRCKFCDKVFLNQLYLKSHISRRHLHMLDEVPQKDEKDTVPSDVTNVSPGNMKLNDEINELKLKLKEMESLIIANSKTEPDKQHGKSHNQVENKKEMKDVEVYTTNNDDVLEKLEEWKKTEQENHIKEINLLRNQIFETLNSFRVTENNKPDESDLRIIEQLRDTIREQGAEILALKQALAQVDIKTKNEDKERKKEIADQMISWAKRDETQSKQYEVLLQKMNEVAREARESRTLAEAEKQRADNLEAMLKERLNHKSAAHKVNEVSNSSTEVSGSREAYNTSQKEDVKSIYRKPTVDQSTMEKLHRKAQELLNIESSISSDTSSAENIGNKHLINANKNSPGRNYSTKHHEKELSLESISSNKVNQGVNKLNLGNKIDRKMTHSKKRKSKKLSPVNKMHENGPVLTPGSPMKVVRAKIMEEVNNRLVEAGVDPLKSRLHRSLYQKQKAQLQQQIEIKSKKYPAYEQVRYTLKAYLDSNASNATREGGFEKDNTNSNSLTKAFSLTSMISNVKSKALSLVKSKEIKRKSEIKAEASELVKKAAAMLKTPPESPIRSDVKRSSPKSPVSQPVKEHNLNEKQNTGSTNYTVHNKTRLSGNHDTEKQSQSPIDDPGSDTDESSSPCKINFPQRPSRSIDNLIKSPARRPSSANADYSNNVFQYTMGNNDDDHMIRSQSVTNVSDFGTYRNDHNDDTAVKELTKGSNKDIQALSSVSKVNKDEDSKLNNLKQTKGVLKNASSIASLNKKKVLFDMDAIQMKSVSASPSQSLTEKSDEKYELGLVNIDNEEWDISSIENEPIKQDTKIQARAGQSLKITELKQSIEAQLARRSETPSTALFGVDVLRGPGGRLALGGSNTSLGSSILDESDNSRNTNQKTLVKPKKLEKDDSELDLSDFSIDELANKNERDSF